MPQPMTLAETIDMRAERNWLEWLSGRPAFWVSMAALVAFVTLSFASEVFATQQQLGEPRLVDLDGDVVQLGRGGHQLRGGLAHAGPDLQQHGRGTAEPRVEVQRPLGQRLHVVAHLLPVRVPGTLLSHGHALAALDEADDGTGELRPGHDRTA